MAPGQPGTRLIRRLTLGSLFDLEPDETSGEWIAWRQAALPSDGTTWRRSHKRRQRGAPASPVWPYAGAWQACCHHATVRHVAVQWRD